MAEDVGGTGEEERDEERIADRIIEGLVNWGINISVVSSTSLGAFCTAAMADVGVSLLFPLIKLVIISEKIKSLAYSVIMQRKMAAERNEIVGINSKYDGVYSI